MTEVKSQMIELGMKAPDFKLPTPDGKMVSLNDFAGSKAYLIMFICNHCPYVKHVKNQLIAVARDYMPKGVAVIGINANDWNTYEGDSPELMKAEAYPFPYVYDESQEVAKSYSAACTPDIYLFDSERNLVYRGQLDSSRPGNDEPVTGKDLRAALDALLSGKEVPEEQRPSSGCNIKWRSGNEPAYFK